MNRLYYRGEGSGPTVILIHGFPLNHSLWNDFGDKLSESLHVVMPDLPGFGKSERLPAGFTLEDVADVMLEWMQEMKFPQPVIVGHSLGGYVGLAMAEKAPERLSGLCLFHSTAIGDSEEKKQSRNKVLEFIDKQGVHAFTSNFVSQLYADPQHSSITKVKNIAVQASREAVVGYTKAMRDRKDRTAVIKNSRKPLLLLTGEKDQGIPSNSILQQAALNPQVEAVVLPDVAHMGMFEAEPACLKKIFQFVEKCRVTF